MIRKQAPRALGVAALAAALGACATGPPAPAAPPRVEAPPTAPSARSRLALPHVEAARRLEGTGDLRRALDEYAIALTIDPGDRATQEARQRLQTKRSEERRVGKECRSGWAGE